MAHARDRDVLEAWLVLLRAPGLGAVGLRRLLEEHGDAPAALAAARRGAHECAREPSCRAWLRAPSRVLLDADLAWLDAPGHALLCCDSEDFPALLSDSPAAPAALFVAGDATALWQPQVAIVGSRNASQAGLANAQSFARSLARAGFAITSGLAEGIDAAAHAAALEAGASTLAVLGTGPDLVYPLRHGELAARIAAQGALVSEFPPGTPAQPGHFPRRNRIIAGLALGTLVVEAGVRSGSLITARNAAEAGREVFAIPGSIHHPLARGCHRLIRQGARLVETADELVEDLAPLAQRLGARLRERLGVSAPEPGVDFPEGPPAVDADPALAALLNALGHETLGMDQLAERSGLPVAALASLLLLAELDGSVVAQPGGFARRVAANG